MQCPCKQRTEHPELFQGKDYQDTPCASCFLTRETHRTNKVSKLYDQDGAQQVDVDQLAAQQDAVADEDYVPQNIPEHIILNIQKACQQNFLVVLSNTVLKLTKMAKDYPALFQVLMIKMQYPYMSYLDIGKHMVPPCSKQNVLYHLSHAVQQFPELSKAILTDTRFSGGRYAIKRVADLVNEQKCSNKVKKLLYAQTDINKAKTIQELQQLFKEPFKCASIDIYDAYAKEQADAGN